MTEQARHEHAAWISGFVLTGGIVVEGTRLALVLPWPGFAPALSLFVSGALSVLWACSLVLLLLRKRFHATAIASFTTTFVAPFSMLAHAAATRVGGSSLGLLYVPAAFVLVVALKRVFDRGEKAALDAKTPANRGAHSS